MTRRQTHRPNMGRRTRLVIRRHNAAEILANVLLVASIALCAAVWLLVPGVPA